VTVFVNTKASLRISVCMMVQSKENKGKARGALHAALLSTACVYIIRTQEASERNKSNICSQKAVGASYATTADIDLASSHGCLLTVNAPSGPRATAW
jgi:hypothetical protein